MAQLSEETLEYCLNQLKVWGVSRLHCENDKWVCILEHVRLPRGVTLSISSEVNHKEPLGAVKQCLKRARSVVNDLIKGE